MQWYVEMLHLINESDRGEGEAQPGNGPEDRGQFKWGICPLEGGVGKAAESKNSKLVPLKNRPSQCNFKQ